MTSSADGTVHIWYTQITDLIASACRWTPRNFTRIEWKIYMEERQGDYRPTCSNAPIPPDAITGIQQEVRQQIRFGHIARATRRLKQLNAWLKINGQFKSYGMDVAAFISEVSVTATAEALSMPVMIPTPSVTPSAMQPVSPLLSQPPSPLPSPTVTPPATRTPVASAPVSSQVR